jgi:hypothetical protein
MLCRDEVRGLRVLPGTGLLKHAPVGPVGDHISGRDHPLRLKHPRAQPDADRRAWPVLPWLARRAAVLPLGRHLRAGCRYRAGMADMCVAGLVCRRRGRMAMIHTAAGWLR